MVTIFNRQELLATPSQEEQARLRDALEYQGIEYVIRADRQPPERKRSGGNEPAQYHIYVRRQDVQEAAAVLAQLRQQKQP